MVELSPLSALTFNNEGNDNPNSEWYTRKAHWPKGASGVTIGRGYDMKERTEEEVKNHLLESGVSPVNANRLAKGAKLVGNNAKEFLKEVEDIELDKDQEIKLFGLAYSSKVKDFNRICQKSSVESLYGKCHLDKIDPKIKEFAIDLLYTGQYVGETRKKIQKAIVTNDYMTLIEVAKDKPLWIKAGENRWRQRVKHLEAAKKQYDINQGQSSSVQIKFPLY